MQNTIRNQNISRAELARQLGVSRTHITLLAQGKRKLSERLADKLADILAGKPNAVRVASNPLGGAKSVFGGFDSHALPPEFWLTFRLTLWLILVNTSTTLLLGRLKLTLTDNIPK